MSLKKEKNIFTSASSAAKWGGYCGNSTLGKDFCRLDSTGQMEAVLLLLLTLLLSSSL